VSEVRIYMTDDLDEDGNDIMTIGFSFDPPPITTDEEAAEFQTIAQDWGMFVVEHLLGYPLTDEDFTPPTVH